MNALARSTALARAVPRAATQARMNSGFAQFRKDWLADSGTYPTIAILGIAILGCSSKGMHYLATHPDARISKSKRSSLVRTWGA